VTGAAAMNESGQLVGTTQEGGANRGWVAGPGQPLTLLPLPAGMVGGLVLLHPRGASGALEPVAAAVRPAILPTSPNPFSGSVEIAYALPAGADPGPVSLAVHDASGREVRRLVDRLAGPGSYTATWNGNNEAGQPVPSGVYFLRMHAGRAFETRRILRVN